MKSTAFWLSVLKKWCLKKRIAEEIENYEAAELNTLLEQFCAKLKSKHGEDYEPESLKVMIVSLDRHLKNKGYSLSIFCDREFSSSKQVPDGKVKQLRLAGRGKPPNKARQLSEEEEEILQQFSLRGRQEHHRMRLEDFGIMKGDDGLEFVEFAEGPTKTRSGCSRLAKRDVQLHYFASTSDVGLPILG